MNCSLCKTRRAQWVPRLCIPVLDRPIAQHHPPATILEICICDTCRDQLPAMMPTFLNKERRTELVTALGPLGELPDFARAYFEFARAGSARAARWRKGQAAVMNDYRSWVK